MKDQKGTEDGNGCRWSVQEQTDPRFFLSTKDIVDDSHKETTHDTAEATEDNRAIRHELVGRFFFRLQALFLGNRSLNPPCKLSMSRILAVDR